MEDKKPTTTKALNHDVRPEHETLRNAMTQWSKQSPKGENRSVIVIQVSEKDGELNASSHINGNGHHLAIAIAACMSACTTDNPVGSILRSAAIKSLTDLGMISPATPDANNQPQPETETPNNNESK